MNHITIKAVNPDNDKELRAIAKLFGNVYSNTQIHTEMLQVEFWKHHVGDSFVSLAAFSGDTLVGHLGITRSRAITGCMELILPAFDVATLHDMYLIAESGYDQIKRLSERQGWNSLACVPFVESVEYLPILTDVLGLSETALLPSSTKEEQHTCASLWFKTMKACSEDTRPIFVDNEFEPLLAALISDLGIPGRTLVTSTDQSARPNLVMGSRQRLCTADVFVHSIHSLGERAKGCPIAFDKPGFFSVDVSVPGAIATSKALADRGFNLCGFIPNYYGADRIVFMNFGLPEAFPEERFSKAGKILSFFMRSAQEDPRRRKEADSYDREFSFPAVKDRINAETTII